ncbi:sensor histidine kinase [Flagellimonas allohymeniacidonis]|nr:histidine kinase [Allomuricauda hymeniacidonis]
MSISRRELIFQIVLIVLVFLFYSFDRENPGLRWSQVAFFTTHVMAAWLIGYWLMPHFLYRKKYWLFFGYVFLIVAAVIGLEELFLEQIFYPGTRRAKSFPGIVFSLMGVLPVITILAGFKFGWDALQKQEQIEELKSTVQESELQFLRTQINPHFLFNNLNNLYSHALEGSKKTPEIILELSGLLRYMLYECKEKFVPLDKEVEQLHNFIKLNKLQIEDRGIVRFDAKGIERGYRIAPLILIVFIENAFKHSQAGQSENIEIAIELEMKEDILHFHSANNYAPSEGLDTIATGIGLKNVKKRLQLLYPDRHELKIHNDGKSYKVNLSMELEKMIGP